jgi:hypothetical protein
MNTWTRWPLASIIPARVFTETRGPDGIWHNHVEVPAFVIECNGRAGDYALAQHSGAWRSLGDLVKPGIERADVCCLDIDATGLRRWVRAYGPLFHPDEDHESFGPAGWEIAAVCRDVATGYGLPGNVGLSRWAGGDQLATRSARLWMAWYLKAIEGDASKRFARWLIESAEQAAKDGVPMRRCLGCSHWIMATRSDRTYCDRTCRAHHATGQGVRGRFRE